MVMAMLGSRSIGWPRMAANILSLPVMGKGYRSPPRGTSRAHRAERTHPRDILSCMNSFQQIMDAARAAGQARFVVAQAADASILAALAEARAAGFARPVLVGCRKDIEDVAHERSLSLGAGRSSRRLRRRTPRPRQ